MLNEFLDWLQERLVKVGLRGLTKAVLGVLGFGVLLSGLLGISAIRSGVIVAVVLALLGMLAILSLNIIVEQRRRRLEACLIVRYCGVLKSRGGQRWRIVRWEESAIVRENGDSSERIVVSAIVESDLLDFFFIRSGSGWDQPERVRRRVRVGVSSLEGEGLATSAWDATSAWLNDGRLEVVVHFASPMRRGSLIKITLDKEWPGKCEPLMKHGRPDEFALRFACPIDYIEYSIVLPVGCDVHCDAIGLRDGIDDYVLGLKSLGPEQIEAKFVARGIAARRRVGMVLRLKERGTVLRRVS